MLILLLRNQQRVCVLKDKKGGEKKKTSYFARLLLALVATDGSSFSSNANAISNASNGSDSTLFDGSILNRFVGFEGFDGSLFRVAFRTESFEIEAIDLRLWIIEYIL